MLCNGVIFALAMTCLKMLSCGAHPLNNYVTSIVDNRLGDVNNDDFKYNLPSIVTEKFMITIKGMINPNDSKFTAVFPSNSGGEDCKFVYDFKTQKIDVTPPSASDHEPIDYILDVNEDTTFSLVIRPRIVRGKYIFDITLHGNEHLNNGESPKIACIIKSFTDISSIVMQEGVKSVSTLLFEFDK